MAFSGMDETEIRRQLLRLQAGDVVEIAWKSSYSSPVQVTKKMVSRSYEDLKAEWDTPPTLPMVLLHAPRTQYGGTIKDYGGTAGVQWQPTMKTQVTRVLSLVKVGTGKLASLPQEDLGMRTASETPIFRDLQRVASQYPETRQHIVPLLQKLASMDFDDVMGGRTWGNPDPHSTPDDSVPYHKHKNSPPAGTDGSPQRKKYNEWYRKNVCPEHKNTCGAPWLKKAVDITNPPLPTGANPKLFDRHLDDLYEVHRLLSKVARFEGYGDDEADPHEYATFSTRWGKFRLPYMAFIMSNHMKEVVAQWDHLPSMVARFKSTEGLTPMDIRRDLGFNGMSARILYGIVSDLAKGTVR